MKIPSDVIGKINHEIKIPSLTFQIIDLMPRYVAIHIDMDMIVGVRARL
jgi:hypothetical protein